MDPIFEHRLLATRRHLLGSMAGGIGAAALGELLRGNAAAAATASDGTLPGLAIDPLASKMPPPPGKVDWSKLWLNRMLLWSMEPPSLKPRWATPAPEPEVKFPQIQFFVTW